MTTAVANDRLTQRFQKWDTNGDGALELADFQEEARRIADAFGKDSSSPETRNPANAFTGLFEYLARQAGVGKNGSLSEDQFIEVNERLMFEEGEASFNRVMRPVIKGVIGMCDDNHDGQINRRRVRHLAGRGRRGPGRGPHRVPADRHQQRRSADRRRTARRGARLPLRQAGRAATGLTPWTQMWLSGRFSVRTATFVSRAGRKDTGISGVRERSVPVITLGAGDQDVVVVGEVAGVEAEHGADQRVAEPDLVAPVDARPAPVHLGEAEEADPVDPRARRGVAVVGGDELVHLAPADAPAGVRLQASSRGRRGDAAGP